MYTDQEQLRALETERAFLLENGKTDRADQVDEQLAAVRARIAAADVAQGAPETTTAEPAPDKPTPRRPGRKAAK